MPRVALPVVPADPLVVPAEPLVVCPELDPDVPAVCATAPAAKPNDATAVVIATQFILIPFDQQKKENVREQMRAPCLQIKMTLTHIDEAR